MPDPAVIAGHVQHITPQLRYILAPNAGPMTYTGTNTFLLGRDQVAVIDPGPDDPDHLQAILDAATAYGAVTHILVTHAHLDHSALARPLSAATGAPIYAFGPPTAGRSALMQELVTNAEIGGGEGVDHSFVPDHVLAHGACLTTADWSIKALHLPGHMASHLGFQWQDMVFCGDVIMAWSSTLISPPDGDLGQFFETLARLETCQARTLFPAHGPAIDRPAKRVTDIRAHLEMRAQTVLDALSDIPRSLMDITRDVYPELAPATWPYASRNALAHLIKLHENGQCEAIPSIAENSLWAKV